MSDLIRALRALAQAKPDADEFTFTRGDGVRVHVLYSGGSSESLVLRSPYGVHGARLATRTGYRTVAAYRAPRPLEIELRRETFADVRHKEGGVNREVQTGDADFDRSVYIHTSASDETVLYVLSQPAARTAIVTLLVDLRFNVVLDDVMRDVVATLTTFENRGEEGLAARIADAFVSLVENLPPVEEQGKRQPSAAHVVLARLGLAAVLLSIISAVVWGAAAPNGCWVSSSDGDGYSLECITIDGHSCCAPMGWGLLAGVVVGTAAGLVVARRFRGRSNSREHRVWAFALTLVVLTEIAWLIAAFLMWW